MKSESTVPLYIPAVFCALISLMALFVGDNFKPVFFTFLPMCFIFVAGLLAAMHKRLRDLEEKLEKADEENS